MEETEKKEDISYYKFGYLLKVNGGASMFGPKRDKLLYIAIILGLSSYIFYRFKFINQAVIINFVNISAVVSVTLFGLIIASFAIVTSINNKELLIKLIKSTYYAYTIFSFTWALIWSLISSSFDLIALLFSVQTLIFPILVFSLFYAIFDTFSSMFFSLRHIAIMNTRYNEDLKQAWKDFEKEIKRRD